MKKAYVMKPIEIKELIIGDWENKCPKCGNKLYFRNEGLVCINWKCEIYWKKEHIFFTSRYNKNSEDAENEPPRIM